MPVTAQELGNIANTTMEYHFDKGGKPFAQAIKDQPLTKAFLKTKKKFPGGKNTISGLVKGDYTTEWMGYSYDDSVTYANPANIKKFEYPWYEMHAGIQVTNTELKENGITVIDTMTGENTSVMTNAEEIQIANLLEDKLNDMSQGSANSFDLILHRDGSQDSKLPPGITSLISSTPTVGLTGGLDRASHSWWQNKAYVGDDKITYSTTTVKLIRSLKKIIRELKKYGGTPNLILAGANAFERLEAEYVSKGNFTLTGFDGKTDISIGEFSIKGVGDVMYDPTLDDEGYSDYIFIVDTNNIFLMVMDGEDNKMHNPARPAEKYVLFRSMTWTGCLIARRLNSSAIIQTYGTL